MKNGAGLNKKKKNKEEIIALLGWGTEFEGKLTFEGAVRVDGIFTGEVQSNGMLIIGEKGFVRADIRASVVLVHGEAHGTIRAQSRVEAYSPAKIYGDIYSPVLVFGEGVVFEGTSHMTGEPEGNSGIQGQIKNGDS
ncbi:MAG: polymer-forming cytoskeletal protein [Deltaproteobacteria bacterium]|nr:polymer-forming cytoskeletal protein [Deltaproteobacteria bacterium]